MPKMKRKETIPGGSDEKGFVLEWSIGEDMPMKRCGVKSRVSNGDTTRSSSSGPKDPSDEVILLVFCRVFQPWKKMRRGVEAQKKKRKMEGPLVVRENN
jgi:hypothetical protein